MYLVVMRCIWDDVPIRLCKTKAEAERIAGSIPWKVPMRTQIAWNFDPTDMVAIGIVRFTTRGMPVGIDMVRIYEDEMAGA